MNLYLKSSKKLFCKKLPNLRKASDFKFNFKSFIDDLPIHKANIKNRKVDADADRVAQQYNEYKQKRDDINLMSFQYNKMKKMITQALKEGGDVSKLTKDSKKHSRDIGLLQKELLNLEERMMNEAISVPNRTHPETPVGDMSQAKIVKSVGEKRINFFT